MVYRSVCIVALIAGASSCGGSEQIGGPTSPTTTAAAPLQPPATLIAGGAHSCALSAAGTAFCWGDGSSGQLGNGSAEPQLAPAPVAGGLLFVTLAAGERTTCGLTIAGAAYCWGKNESGEVGDGTTTADRLAPSAVAGGVTFVSLAAGYYHMCGLTITGNAFCWGYDASGQLGDGTMIESRAIPSPVSGSARFVSLTGGYWHTCGLTLQGNAQCWGNNNWGQLGDSTRAARSNAAAVASGVVFTKLAAGGRHSCGLTTVGAVYCWGWNGFGQIGDGTTTIRLTPVPVIAPAGLVFVDIAAGWYHTCALTAAGAAYCWGFNAHGQLGDASTTDRTKPSAVAGSLAFSTLALGVDHTCGRTTAGVAYCWGSNVSGQLGDGTTRDISVATAVRAER